MRKYHTPRNSYKIHSWKLKPAQSTPKIFIIPFLDFFYTNNWHLIPAKVAFLMINWQGFFGGTCAHVPQLILFKETWRIASWWWPPFNMPRFTGQTIPMRYPRGLPIDIFVSYMLRISTGTWLVGEKGTTCYVAVLPHRFYIHMIRLFPKSLHPFLLVPMQEPPSLPPKKDTNIICQVKISHSIPLPTIHPCPPPKATNKTEHDTSKTPKKRKGTKQMGETGTS